MVIGTVSSGNSPVIRFDEDNSSSALWSFIVPDDVNASADMEIVVFWSPEDNLGADDAVRFDLSYQSFANGDDVSAAFSTDNTTDTPPGAALEMEETTSGNLTIGNAAIAANELVNIKLTRDPSDASDTYGDDNGGADPGDINIHGIRIEYQGKKIQ